MEQCSVCYERDAKYKVCKNKHKLCFECYEKINEDNKICPYCRSNLCKLTIKYNPNLFNKPVFKKRISFAKKFIKFIENRHFLCATQKFDDFKKYSNLFERHFKDDYFIYTNYNLKSLFTPIFIPKDPQEIIKMEKIINYRDMTDTNTKTIICSFLYNNLQNTESFDKHFNYFFGYRLKSFNEFINEYTFYNHDILSYIFYGLIQQYK